MAAVLASSVQIGRSKFPLLAIYRLCRQPCSPVRYELSCLNHFRTATTSSSSVSDVQRLILEQSLCHVPQYGWSDKCIAYGAQDCGYSSSAQGMFPRGGADLALYFYKKSNQELLDQLDTKIMLATDKFDGTRNLSTENLIRDALEARIRMTSKHQDSWSEAMALLAHPNAVADALSLLCQLMDDVWYIAGDRSHDMNWYTKRASLAYIYKTTELFMLADKSEDLEQTWKFLDRRFKDVGVVGTTLSTANDLTQGLINGGFNSLRTVLGNIVGVRPR